MPKLYLVKQYYQAMSNDTLKKPRERFIRYYNDLFNLEGVTQPPMSAYMLAGQYDFATLGDAVLKPAQVCQDFFQCDLLVVAYWGHEFDPDGSFGAYFSHQYDIHSTLFDVCDQGILSPIMALKLIMAYAKLGKIKKAALLCLDQKVIPVEPNFTGIRPASSSARLIFFSTKKRSITDYQLLEAVLDQQTTMPRKNLGMQNIMIEPESPYYSTAELFTPLFDKTIIKSLYENICIKIVDSESDRQGSLIFKRTYPT